VLSFRLLLKSTRELGNTSLGAISTSILLAPSLSVAEEVMGSEDGTCSRKRGVYQLLSCPPVWLDGQDREDEPTILSVARLRYAGDAILALAEAWTVGKCPSPVRSADE
jgi:hypothetical protein